MNNSDALTRCVQEFSTLVGLANLTLKVGIYAAILITIIAIVERVVRLWRKPGEAGGGDGTPASFIDSLKGLITALAAAPAWFAIFLAGILLLWCAEKFTPAECQKQLSVSTAAPTQGAGGGEQPRDGSEQKPK